MRCNAFVADEMLAQPNAFDRFMFDVLGETELQKSPQKAGVKTSHTLKLIVDSMQWVASARRHSRPQHDPSSRRAELRERARKCVATKEHLLYERFLMVALQQKDLYHSDVIVIHLQPPPSPPPPVTGPRHGPVLLWLSCSQPVKHRKLRNFGRQHKSGESLFTYEY